MTTKRQAIESLREKLRERNADSTYSNQFLYSVLSEHSKWLIRREVSAGRIYSNNSIFQTLSCIKVVETSTIDACCPVKVNCKIYRTDKKIPDAWIDLSGPILRSITSVDGTTDFILIGSDVWMSKRNDPYNKMMDNKYAFFADGYLWFPEHNPNRVNIFGFFVDDISDKNECSEKKECVRFLDTKFLIPDWLLAECMSKALEQLAGVTKRLPEQNQIDKNPTRKD